MPTPPQHEALASTQARLELLLQASERLGRSLDYEATLADLATLLVPRLADGYVVDMVDEHGAIRRVAAVDENPAQAANVEKLKHLGAVNPKAPEGIQRLLAEGVSRVNERITPEGLRAGARDDQHFALLMALDLSSGIIVPLKDRGRAIGLLWLYYARSRRTYTAADLPLVEEMAARAALAIENARLYREAQEAIRTRDDFLAIASHELRTPLTSLLLRVQGELRRVHRDPGYAPTHAEHEAWLAAASAQVSKLAHLVEELLDVSRMTSGQFRLAAEEEVDLTAIVRGATGTLAEEAVRRGSALDVRGEPGIVGKWDPMRVEQVVIALVSNAIKYGDGKPFDVVVTREHGAAPGGAAMGGEVAVITVHDHGIGIDVAHQGSIFERFERRVSSRHYGGFGVGLWVARQIVEASGGQIKVESGIGHGATFRVELPIAAR